MHLMKPYISRYKLIEKKHNQPTQHYKYCPNCGQTLDWGGLQVNIKRFRKMQRKHTKELVKAAKKAKDFDYWYFHELVTKYIRNMYEMYSDRECIFQSDESRLEIVNQLKEIIDLNDKLSVAVTYEDERDILKQMYTKIGENIMYWWD